MKKIKQFCALFLLVILPSFLASQTLALDTPLLDFDNLIADNQEPALVAEMERVSTAIGYPVGAILYNQGGTYGTLLSEVKSGDGPVYFGTDRILILVNLNTREMAIDLNGTAKYAMDDWETNLILDEVAPYFTNGNFLSGIQVFLSMTESTVLGIVTEAETERMRQERLEELLPTILFSILFSGITAGAVVFFFVRSMNNVKNQQNASAYEAQGGFRITHDRETYLYRNVSKVPRQQNNGGGGRGGGGGGRGSFSGGGSRGF